MRARRQPGKIKRTARAGAAGQARQRLAVLLCGLLCCAALAALRACAQKAAPAGCSLQSRAVQENVKKAIETMTRPTVLILGGSDKGVSFDPLAETLVHAPQIIHCVLIGDTAPQIEASLARAGYTAVTHAGHDFDRCIALCRELAVPGGCVLLSPACASFDMFKDYEDRGRVFKEKVMALV